MELKTREEALKKIEIEKWNIIQLAKINIKELPVVDIEGELYIKRQDAIDSLKSDKLPIKYFNQ